VSAAMKLLGPEYTVQPVRKHELYAD
jgi:hypothetical protein